MPSKRKIINLLGEYIENEHVKVSYFAQKIDIPYNSLRKILDGEVYPTFPQSIKIEKATHGIVRKEYWFNVVLKKKKKEAEKEKKVEELHKKKSQNMLYENQDLDLETF